MGKMGARVSETDLKDNAVTSPKIKDDEIVNADINSAAAIALSKLAAICAFNVFKPMLAYDSVVAGTWANYISGSQPWNGGIWNSSLAQNDELQFKFFSKSGSYTFVIIVVTHTDQGIIDVSIDGTSQGTIDTYAAATAYGVMKTLAVTVATDGEHTLNLKVTDKHGSSSGYVLRASAWWLRT
jgi:hypothetical protein